MQKKLICISLNDAKLSYNKILILNLGFNIMMGNDANLASCFHENAKIIYLYITIKPCNFASGNFISHTGKTRICEKKNNYENDFTPTIIFILIVIISRLLFVVYFVIFNVYLMANILDSHYIINTLSVI